jgi:predicted nucleic acid-binding protein
VRVILDTNVFVSGIFFGGPPYRILKAWRDGELRLVVSQEILNEHQRVGEDVYTCAQIPLTQNFFFSIFLLPKREFL